MSGAQRPGYGGRCRGIHVLKQFSHSITVLPKRLLQARSTQLVVVENSQTSPVRSGDFDQHGKVLFSGVMLAERIWGELRTEVPMAE